MNKYLRFKQCALCLAGVYFFLVAGGSAISIQRWEGVASKVASRALNSAAHNQNGAAHNPITFSLMDSEVICNPKKLSVTH